MAWNVNVSTSTVCGSVCGGAIAVLVRILLVLLVNPRSPQTSELATCCIDIYTTAGG